MVFSIKFGTDGWRGVIAEDFTFDNVRACAQGVADYLKETKIAAHGLENKELEVRVGKRRELFFEP